MANDEVKGMPTGEVDVVSLVHRTTCWIKGYVVECILMGASHLFPTFPCACMQIRRESHTDK